VASRILANLQYWSWRAASAVIGRLPLRVSYSVAWALGSVAYFGWPRGRRSMHANFRRVLPGANAKRIRRTSRMSLVNYCKYLVDFIRFPRESAAVVLETVKGDEPYAELRRLLDRGNGGVIVCMHFGNWDLGAGATAARDFSVTVVAETFADPRLDRMVMGAREKLGMNILKMEKAGPSLLRTLKSNGLLALLIDRSVPGEGVKVQFFGEEVEVPAGPARLALRTGAVIVPCAFPRIDPLRPEVLTLAEFLTDHPKTGDTERDTRELTQQIMDSHERFIRAHPEQWYMFRPMWNSSATVTAG